MLTSYFGVCSVGYAFIYFEDERDAEDAIRRLDSADFGHSRRRLSVEWSRVNLRLRALMRYFWHRQTKGPWLIAVVLVFNFFSKKNQYRRTAIGLQGMRSRRQLAKRAKRTDGDDQNEISATSDVEVDRMQ